MSDKPLPVVAVPEDGSTVVVGMAGLPCPLCNDIVPVTVEAAIAPDEDGDDAFYTRSSTIELESHMLGHQLVL